MFAAQWGKLEALQFLLNRGADVNATSAAGMRALDYALTGFRGISRPHFCIAQTLVLAGALVRYRDVKWGSTMLMFAARWGDSLFARFLISRGADVDAVGWSGKTALDFELDCFKGGPGPHFKIVQALVEAGGISFDTRVRNAGQSTPLMFAAQEGGKEFAAFFIDRGADVNGVDALGNTSLDFALVEFKGAGPHLEVAYQLSAAGAAVERSKHPEQCREILY